MQSPPICRPKDVKDSAALRLRTVRGLPSIPKEAVISVFFGNEGGTNRRQREQKKEKDSSEKEVEKGAGSCTHPRALAAASVPMPPDSYSLL